ncbi:DUF6210 family protein [Corallococcus exercitus]|uniref:Uncharacterized protein n=1 Tax=Corallococcus exercitus TaxID=2316736 RepID=A0A7Y4NDP5_9BACT|nr:DUF6210 family protein [Corallococcus exercitus]NOK09641.1 hypothetical protein [Corallococcus exercitus]
MSSLPLIRLYDSTSLGLILLWPTGILYSNQTGGSMCLQPQAEGAFLPLVDELVAQEDLLRQHFTGPKWRGACGNGIDEETAQEIDRILGLSSVTRELGLRVDRARLEESHEAWVYVEVPAQPENRLASLERIPASQGILTWANSD